MGSGTKVTTAEIEEVRWVVPSGRAADVVAYEEEMIRFFIDTADLLGVPKSLAAVYGVIFATPEPLSFSEIAAKLNFSNGSVSQALRVLRDMGAVRAADDGVKAEGRGRAAARDRFVPDLELRKLVSRFIEQRLEKQLAIGSTRLEILRRTMPSNNRSNAELGRRLKSLADWHTRARQLLPVVRTVLRITP